jgi:DNA polymerase-3 subunit alpha
MDLHRHDELSTFDGFGKPLDLAKLAKRYGYTALGISNHGNMHSVISHYNACNEVGIKPVLGIEGYFQPEFDKEKPRYHLCLYAKNLEGYQNLNRIIYNSEVNHKYYKPNIVYEDLETYNKGIICTSACIAGYVSQSLINGSRIDAKDSLIKFKEIFKNDFYIEIQPYNVYNDVEGEKVEIQKNINAQLVKLANELDIKIIFTSDSHYDTQENFDTYLKMHHMSKSKITYDLTETYFERYMPKSYDEMYNRTLEYHGKGFKKYANKMILNLKELESKIDNDILGTLKLELPKMSLDSKKILKKNIIQGLKDRGRYSKEYIDQVKKEYEAITHLGFEDYFLMVQDYINFAKENGIKCGPGRGSACNSLISYALKITEIDSYKYNLNFERFIRKDKLKLSDIDADFESARRDEVIEYILNKYPGKSAQICNYGRYKSDNLINDLVKVCDCEFYKKDIKSTIKKYITEDGIDDFFEKSSDYNELNRDFDNIAKHFVKLFNSVRFIGTHAAGVAVVGDDLLDHCPIVNKQDKKYTMYDLEDIEQTKVIKFDILSIITLDKIKELEEITGVLFTDDMLEDQKLLIEFEKGNTEGIFQFESKGAKNVLGIIGIKCFEDVIAANSLNRPGPLSMQMHEQFARNRYSDYKSLWYEFTKDTYGTIVYQEQIMDICKEYGGLNNDDTDFVIKKYDQLHNRTDIKETFISNCMQRLNITQQQTNEIFNAICIYSFNKGHATGYSYIGLNEMFYKVNYPLEFWCVKIKYADKIHIWKYRRAAVKEECVLMIPHINRSDARTALVDFEDSKVIQEGLSNVDFVGEKAAQVICDERKKNGKFVSLDDFINRVPKKSVNKRCIDELTKIGALEFDDQEYYSKCVKYNSNLYAGG